LHLQEKNKKIILIPQFSFSPKKCLDFFFPVLSSWVKSQGRRNYRDEGQGTKNREK